MFSLYKQYNGLIHVRAVNSVLIANLFPKGQENLLRGVLRVSHNSNTMSDKQGNRILSREGKLPA